MSELRSLINRHSKENGSDTPDFVLAQYLQHCLDAFNYATRYRQSVIEIAEAHESEEL